MLLFVSIVLVGCVRDRPRPLQPRTPLVFVDPEPDRAVLVPAAVVKERPALKDDSVPSIEPAPPPPKLSLSELVTGVNAKLRDVFFAYDSFTLDAAATQALEFNHSVLRPLLSDFPRLEVVIEGHCDERGSAEYNLGLGDFRAKRALDFLRELGLASATLRPVSYGREKPQCSEPSEACWSRNRRAHLFVEPPR